MSEGHTAVPPRGRALPKGAKAMKLRLIQNMLAVCATRGDRHNTRRACAARSQWQWSRFSARAQNLQIVRVVHDPQDVPERVDHRSGNEPLFAVCGRLVLFRSHGQQLLEHCCHIIDVPVHDNTARTGRRTRGRVPCDRSNRVRAGSRRGATRHTVGVRRPVATHLPHFANPLDFYRAKFPVIETANLRF